MRTATIDATDLRPSEIAEYVSGLNGAISHITDQEQDIERLQRTVNGLRLQLGWTPLEFEPRRWTR